MNSDLACVYAALILADDNVEITADKISSILKSANIDFVESYLPRIYESGLKGKSVKDMLTNVGSAAAAPVAAAPVAETAAQAKEEKPAAKEEKKPISDDSDDEPMGFGLFD